VAFRRTKVVPQLAYPRYLAKRIKQVCNNHRWPYNKMAVQHIVLECHTLVHEDYGQTWVDRHSLICAHSSWPKRYHHTCRFVGAKILCRIGIFNHNKTAIKSPHVITVAMSIGSLVSLSGA
jgi:hypothetical protein